MFLTEQPFTHTHTRLQMPERKHFGYFLQLHRHVSNGFVYAYKYFKEAETERTGSPYFCFRKQDATFV